MSLGGGGGCRSKRGSLDLTSYIDTWLCALASCRESVPENGTVQPLLPLTVDGRNFRALLVLKNLAKQRVPNRRERERLVAWKICTRQGGFYIILLCLSTYCGRI